MPVLESGWQDLIQSSWVRAALAPALGFWIAFGFVYSVLWVGYKETVTWWDGLSDSARVLWVIAGLGLIALTTFLISLLGNLLLRWAEGYWENIPIVGRPLKKWKAEDMKHRLSRPRARAEELLGKYVARYQPDRLPPTIAGQPAIQPITAEEEAELRELDRRLYDAPPEGEEMPTQLGNVLRAAERRVLYLYGIDSVIAWPRFYPLLSQTLREQVDNTRTSLDAKVRSYFLLILFGATCVTLAAVDWSGRSPMLLGAAIAGLLLAATVWRGTLETGWNYAELIRSAFELHRFDLYETLRLPLPANSAEDRQIGRRATRQFWRGEDGDYKHNLRK